MLAEVHVCFFRSYGDIQRLLVEQILPLTHGRVSMFATKSSFQ